MAKKDTYPDKGVSFPNLELPDLSINKKSAAKNSKKKKRSIKKPVKQLVKVKKLPKSLKLPDLSALPIKKSSPLKKTNDKSVLPKKVFKKQMPPQQKKVESSIPLKDDEELESLKAHPIPKPKPKITKLKTKSPRLRPAKDIAMDFATKVHKKFDIMVKATVLFGSQTTNEVSSTSDIDIVIIVDDAGIQWDMELIAWYREELAKLVAAQEYAKDLHVNTIRLTTWWTDLMHGDPVIINILRYGQALIDFGGFFKPLKVLLYEGKIHSTPEAVYAALQRAPMHLARSQYAELGAIEGVYWTMVDSAQAALITLGKLPPSPEHITGMLKENFVDTGLLKLQFIKWYRDIYDLHKRITHGEVRTIKGVELDEWQDRADNFMRKMSEIIDKLVDETKGYSN